MAHESGSTLIDGIDVSQPPAGVTYDPQSNDLMISVRHFSISLVLKRFFIFLFRIIVLLVLIALAFNLIPMVGFADDLNPEPAENGSLLMGILNLPWEFTKFFVIFSGMWGILFIGSVLLIFLCLRSLVGAFSLIAGKTIVSVSQGAGMVMMGIGPLSRRYRFQAKAIKDVRLERKWRRHKIVIETDIGRKIRFGNLLTEERKDFLTAVLRKVLLEQHP